MSSNRVILVILIIILISCWYANQNKQIESFNTNPVLDQLPFRPDVIQYKCKATTERLHDIQNMIKNQCEENNTDQYLNYRQTNSDPVINQDVRETSNNRRNCRDNTEREIIYDINSSSWCSINTSLKAPENNRDNKHLDNKIKTDVLDSNKHLLNKGSQEMKVVDNYLNHVNDYIL